MQIKKFLLIALLLPVAFFSCKKDDDKNKEKIIKDDPRIRTMYIGALSPTTFVVNDVEGLIFNYDSLAYETPIHALTPTFSGFGGALTFQYKYGKKGEWKKYTGSGVDKKSLNFDSVAGGKKFPVFIKSTAIDSTYTKEYQIKVLVHKFDVDAFEWKKAGTLPIQGKVVSQKTIVYNQKYYFFYRNEAGNSFVLTSTDGITWKESAITNIVNPNWETLTSFLQPQKVVVQAGVELDTCDLSTGTYTFAPLGNTDFLKTPLFTLGNNFWAIGNEDGTNYLYSLAGESGEFQQGIALSERVPVEKITTFVSPSGTTSLGYIFGGESATGNGTVWGVDVNGNIVELSQNQSVFPLLTRPIPVFFGNQLSMLGGIANGEFTNHFYTSSNSGAAWAYDRHKILPEKFVGLANGFLFEYERNEVILIGGESAAGFSPSVWKGTLKRKILDNKNNGNTK